jgi:DNA-binding CsgD family transcriptional regulator
MDVNYIIKHHLSLHSANDIGELFKPLSAKFQLTYFDHYRIYKDNTCAILCNHWQWTAYFLKQKYAIPSWNHYKKSGYFLWCGNQALLTYDEQVHHASKFFDINNGVTIIKHNSSYYDMYNFATSANNSGVINFYLNNFDLLENFILYYKEKAGKLIDISSKNKLILPVRPDNIAKNIDAEISNYYLHTNIFSKIQQLNICKSNFKISHREQQTLFYLLRGKTAKEIGCILNISPKTVEYYIENLKNKFNCHSRSELISKGIENGCLNLFLD